AVEMLRVVRRRQERVRLRIPEVRVDAVQDADEIGAPASKDAIESEPGLGRLDLAGIRPADRRDHARVDDAAFEQADAPPELQAIDRELVPAEIEPRQPGRLEDSLVREVVNREHG